MVGTVSGSDRCYLFAESSDWHTEAADNAQTCDCNRGISSIFRNPLFTEWKDPDKILSPEEIITMDWLADNVIGTIPKSRELKEQAKPVTLQSGVESQKG